jgi:TolB protein
MNADGSNRTELTTGPVEDDSPAWSPDGTRIAFSRSPIEGGENAQVFVINVDGSGLKNLTNDPANDHLQPAWAPDGSTIAFLVPLPEAGTPSDIYLMDADGSNSRRLTDLSAVRSFAWSPDGTHIAAGIATCCVDSMSWIDVMKADGSGVTQITNGQAPADDPAWSPDGTMLAFVVANDERSQIWAMNADGTGAHMLTSDPQARDAEPAWR